MKMIIFRIVEVAALVQNVVAGTVWNYPDKKALFPSDLTVTTILNKNRQDALRNIHTAQLVR